MTHKEKFKETALSSKKEKKCKTNKWDKSLLDFKNYTRKYIKHYKKSLTGDLISLTKYPYMKIRTEIIAERLLKAQRKSVLSSEQIDRFVKIKMKVIKSITYR